MITTSCRSMKAWNYSNPMSSPILSDPYPSPSLSRFVVLHSVPSLIAITPSLEYFNMITLSPSNSGPPIQPIQPWSPHIGSPTSLVWLDSLLVGSPWLWTHYCYHQHHLTKKHRHYIHLPSPSSRESPSSHSSTTSPVYSLPWMYHGLTFWSL